MGENNPTAKIISTRKDEKDDKKLTKNLNMWLKCGLRGENEQILTSTELIGAISSSCLLIVKLYENTANPLCCALKYIMRILWNWYLITAAGFVFVINALRTIPDNKSCKHKHKQSHNSGFKKHYFPIRFI